MLSLCHNHGFFLNGTLSEEEIRARQQKTELKMDSEQLPSFLALFFYNYIFFKYFLLCLDEKGRHVLQKRTLRNKPNLFIMMMMLMSCSA